MTGGFLITATDFIISDYRESIRIAIKYNSSNQTEGILGKGWVKTNPNIKPPGFIFGFSPSQGGEGQARAHLLGKQLGGSGDEEANLVTFLQNPTNNSQMKMIENEVASYVRNEQQDVYYTVTPLYDGDNEAPYGVRMEAASVNGDALNIDQTIIETEPSNQEQSDSDKYP